jgi:hypothetical protein
MDRSIGYRWMSQIVALMIPSETFRSAKSSFLLVGGPFQPLQENQTIIVGLKHHFPPWEG